MNNHKLDNSCETDLDRTITWQYDNAARLIASIGILKDFAQQSTENYWNTWKGRVVDIDTADDFGLSIWGKILSCPRPTLSDGALSTEVYRRILKARFRLLNSNGSIDAYSRYINEAFDGNVEVIDGHDMSLTFNPKDDNTLTDEELELIENFKDIAFVYPSGVRDNFECDDPVIGFDGQENDELVNVETLNNGTFHWGSHGSDSGEKKDIGRAKVAGIAASYQVTGSQIRPEVTVTYDGTELTEDADFVVQYGPNTEKGFGSVAILGTGEYSGSITRRFSIVGIDISDAVIDQLESSYEQFAEPIPRVRINGVSLANGTDFSCDYNLDYVGNGSIVLNGIGKYDGRAVVNVSVTKRSLSFVNPSTTDNATISMTDYSDSAVSVDDMYYSTDKGITWTSWITSNAITVAPGSEIRIKRTSNTAFGGSSDGAKFSIPSSLHCYGSVSSLMDNTEFVQLPDYCFKCLFKSCKILDAPEIPFYPRSESCFEQMFMSCNELISADIELLDDEDDDNGHPSSTHRQMFSGCSSMTIAPKIHLHTANITDFGWRNFRELFHECNNLHSVNLYATDLPVSLGSSGMQNWLPDSSSASTVFFHLKSSNKTSSGFGSFGVNLMYLEYIPLAENWKLIADFDTIIENPLRFRIENSYGSSTIKTASSLNGKRKIAFSLDDGATWTFHDFGRTQVGELVHIETICEITGNQSVSLIAVNPTGYGTIGGDTMELVDTNLSDFGGFRFAIEGSNVVAEGNVASIINPEQATPLSSTTIGLASLFAGCDKLVSPPALPAWNNTMYLSSMFLMSGIRTAPSIPINGRYNWMFLGCNGITETPVFPFTTTKRYMCQGMFKNCENLITAKPLLPETLEEGCYEEMFYGCTSLSLIEIRAKSWGGTSQQPTDDWVSGVNGNGVMKKPPELPDERGDSRIPTNFSIEIISA